MRRCLLFVGVTAFAYSPTVTVAQSTSDVGSLQELVGEWTELRRVIAEERSDWKVEKVYLEDNLELVTRQIEVIKEKLEETEGVGDETSLEIGKLDVKKVEYEEASGELTERMGDLEASVRGLVGRFPPPLMNTVEPLLRRIPEDGNDTSLALGQRLQNVVGIISLAEKFNSSLIYQGEVRDLNGVEKQVWTLYWGLAASFSADAQGTGALIGYPSTDGWVFENRSELADTIVSLLQIYDGQLDPDFISTPAQIR